ncbi:MAG: hypothetical protein H7251_13340, partial [Acetobacteraceae bacterium]|nr:hypothetical protein [Acetobacteraceae bacterium]
SGFQYQDRSNGAPGTRQFVDRLGQFLTLVGLTALVVAGVGVGGVWAVDRAGVCAVAAGAGREDAGGAAVPQHHRAA